MSGGLERLIVAVLMLGYDRGRARNRAADLGLAEAPVATADGGIVVGLGTHFRTPDARKLAAEAGARAERIRTTFRTTFPAAPVGRGWYLVPDDEAPRALLAAELDRERAALAEAAAAARAAAEKAAAEATAARQAAVVAAEAAETEAAEAAAVRAEKAAAEAAETEAAAEEAEARQARGLLLTTAFVDVVDVGLRGGLAADGLREWAATVARQVADVRLGAGRAASADGLARLRALCACPLLAAETREEMAALLARAEVGAGVGGLARTDLVRKLGAIEVRPRADLGREPLRRPAPADLGADLAARAAPALSRPLRRAPAAPAPAEEAPAA